ncbi:type I methionyl aminopeptidase [Candidatus Peregrinibacteria bacterium]|nr:type I methionyl aminopeptidase [Candidatus Peregrinibacteria bacterium]
MAIIIKTKDEIELMRESGKILAEILKNLSAFVKIGMSTHEINVYAEKLMHNYNVQPSFKGFHGYPAALCTSVNEQVVHSIPSEKKILKDGDILTIDCGVLYKGFHSDSAVTLFIGNVQEDVKEFVYIVKKALYETISKIKEGEYLNIIGDTIQKIIEEQHGFSVVKELTGHGIGRQLHEDPYIVNYKEKSPGPVLKAGMTIAIEPIVAMGSGKIRTLKDKWTIITQDGLPACQWEHTVVVTKTGAEILTK